MTRALWYEHELQKKKVRCSQHISRIECIYVKDDGSPWTVDQCLFRPSIPFPLEVTIPDSRTRQTLALVEFGDNKLSVSRKAVNHYGNKFARVGTGENMFARVGTGSANKRALGIFASSGHLSSIRSSVEGRSLSRSKSFDDIKNTPSQMISTLVELI